MCACMHAHACMCACECVYVCILQQQTRIWVLQGVAVYRSVSPCEFYSHGEGRSLSQCVAMYDLLGQFTATEDSAVRDAG